MKLSQKLSVMALTGAIVTTGAISTPQPAQAADLTGDITRIIAACSVRHPISEKRRENCVNERLGNLVEDEKNKISSGNSSLPLASQISSDTADLSSETSSLKDNVNDTSSNLEDLSSLGTDENGTSSMSSDINELTGDEEMGTVVGIIAAVAAAVGAAWYFGYGPLIQFRLQELSSGSSN